MHLKPLLMLRGFVRQPRGRRVAVAAVGIGLGDGLLVVVGGRLVVGGRVALLVAVHVLRRGRDVGDGRVARVGDELVHLRVVGLDVGAAEGARAVLVVDDRGVD